LLALPEDFGSGLFGAPPGCSISGKTFDAAGLWSKRHLYASGFMALAPAQIAMKRLRYNAPGEWGKEKVTGLDRAPEDADITG